MLMTGISTIKITRCARLALLFGASALLVCTIHFSGNGDVAWPTLAEIRAFIPQKSERVEVALLVQPNVSCSGLDLAAAVKSRVLDFDKRTFIRNSWGRELKEEHNAAVIFALGKHPSHNFSVRLQEEIDEFRDILIGDFEDNYLNLTLKHLAVMQWERKCIGPKFFYNLDDDFLVLPQNLGRFLANAKIQENVIYGDCFTEVAPVNRILWHKNSMPESSYPLAGYPPFCKGWGRIVSADVPGQIIDATPSFAFMSRFSQVEDVFYTGFVRLNTPIQLVNINYLMVYIPLEFCILPCYRTDMIQVGELSKLKGLENARESFKEQMQRSPRLLDEDLGTSDGASVTARLRRHTKHSNDCSIFANMKLALCKVLGHIKARDLLGREYLSPGR